MPYNKNAAIRYLAIDQCLHDQVNHYGLRELREACNRALSLNGDDGVTLRTIQNDLDFMRSSDGYNAEIDEYFINRRKYFKYSDPHFTISRLPINREEYGILQQLLGLVSRFEGSAIGWLSDLEMHINDTLHSGQQRRPVVAFEENPDLRNVQLLRRLFGSTVDKKVVRITYRPFGCDVEEYIVSPYYLKQYNRRWFLLGRIAEGKLYTFPIDRIEEIADAPEEQYEEADIDFDEYFFDIIGVTRYAERPVEKIVLAVRDTRFPYIDTNPIHPTQKRLRNYHMPESLPDFVAVSINVSVNHELINTLLSYGCDMVVLSPHSLQEEIRSNLNRSLQNYFHL